MKTLFEYSKPAAIIITLILTACSDQAAETSAGREKVGKGQSFDHAHGTEVTDMDKHTFEHDFAEQCIDRETRNSNNPEESRKRMEKPCLCIASHMMKGLTAAEAKKFLTENKNTRSMEIRFDAAAYHCLQVRKKPQAPVIFQQR